MKIPQEVRKLIESGTPAHLVTLNRDGSPQLTLVWIGLDGDDVVAGHLPENQKVKNIRHDPRVAISLQANTKSSMGLTEYAVLYGEAHIEEGGAPELLQRLAGVKFPPMDNPPRGSLRAFESTESRGWAHGRADLSEPGPPGTPILAPRLRAAQVQVWRRGTAAEPFCPSRGRSAASCASRDGPAGTGWSSPAR
ncbi:MAG TPA: pyridoxamine 5'-phosphate oxidase family protein [Anaerolineae bacterium]|nr:pyridoxamine 5'-phosphate oxidase family protein [Anaerolineae bacterium]